MIKFNITDSSLRTRERMKSIVLDPNVFSFSSSLISASSVQYNSITYYIKSGSNHITNKQGSAPNHFPSKYFVTKVLLYITNHNSVYTRTNISLLCHTPASIKSSILFAQFTARTIHVLV